MNSGQYGRLLTNSHWLIDMSNSEWKCLEPDVATICNAAADPIASLARGDVAALIVRQAFPVDECSSLIEYLMAEELLFSGTDPRIDQAAIPADRADRWTRPGTNPVTSRRRRIDIGTSLGNLGDHPEEFFRHSAETHELFRRLFADRPDPISAIYDNLRQLSPGKTVLTARESDGREYGPAIFRAHYGGYTYGPHFDSVREREVRNGYTVYRFERQLAGVLCVQNSVVNGVAAQGIIHRQFWNPEITPILKSGTFHEYADREGIESIQVDLEPGDLYFFNTGMIHEVPGVPGELPRIVLATFIGYSDNVDEVMVWS